MAGTAKVGSGHSAQGSIEVMFTGLIEEMGKILKIQSNSAGKLFQIEARKVIRDLKIGESVAIDGACLSVVEFGSSCFTVQAVQETLTKSNLNFLKVGDYVNLERAMLATSRFGGHFVQGHVDGVGKLISLKSLGESGEMSLLVTDELLRYIVPKGSIAINGISLTVVSVESAVVRIALIPLTLTGTNLKYKKNGDFLNIEVDLLAKYIERFANREPISEAKIKSWGYDSQDRKRK
jgi:riboflavin synthase